MHDVDVCNDLGYKGPRVAPWSQRPGRVSCADAHLHSALLPRLPLDSQIGGAKGSLAQEHAWLVVLPAIRVPIGGQDPGTRRLLGLVAICLCGTCTQTHTQLPAAAPALASQQALWRTDPLRSNNGLDKPKG